MVRRRLPDALFNAMFMLQRDKTDNYILRWERPVVICITIILCSLLKHAITALLILDMESNMESNA